MAWTEITRPKYQRDGLRYASDTTDEEWALIEPHIPLPASCGRPRETSMREVVNAIFYIAQTGCQWRLLPRGSHRPSSITASDREARFGSPSINACPSGGFLAASAVSDLGSFATFKQTVCIAVARLPSSTVRDDCLRAATATSLFIGCSAADRWIAHISTSDVSIESWLRITTGRIFRHHPSQSGCGGRHIPVSRGRSRTDRTAWT